MTDTDLDETLQIVPSLVAILRSESDRGCVLLAASLLEDELENHLLRHLLPPAKEVDELFAREARGPLSAFSDKINLAYRLGLITKGERVIFHQLRELRNACAHNVSTQAFTQDHFRDRTANMIEQSKDFWSTLHAAVVRQMGTENAPSTVRELVKLMTWRYAFEFFFSLVVADKRVQLSRVRLPPPNAA